MRLILSVIVTAIMVLGCKNPIDETNTNNSENSIEVFTDSTSYTFDRNPTTIMFTIKNRSDSTHYFYHCADMIAYYTYRLENEVWTERGGWGILCLAIFSSGVKALEADSSYISHAQISGHGTYRLKFPCSTEFGTNLTDSLVSNEFIVQ